MEKDIIKAENPQPVKTTKCLNCDTEFEGKFCPECGQSADTGRFTIRFIFENLLKAILSNDGGVWITLKSLFTRPGQMMVDIINGKRKSYFSPFPMLFLTLSLYVIIFTFTGSKENKYDELYSGDAKKEIKKIYEKQEDFLKLHDNLQYEFNKDYSVEHGNLYVTEDDERCDLGKYQLLRKQTNKNESISKKEFLDGFVDNLEDIIGRCK